MDQEVRRLAGIALLGCDGRGPRTAVADRTVGCRSGRADLPETRTVETLQPGVTLTTIVRGEADPDQRVDRRDRRSPAAVRRPRPGRAAHRHRRPGARRGARAMPCAATGSTRGSRRSPRPALADFAGGTLGYRVRVGLDADKAAADADARAGSEAAGFTASTVFTGWDGAATDRGPWRVQLLTIDPRTFRGDLVGGLRARPRTARDHQRARPGAGRDRGRQRRVLRARPGRRRARRSGRSRCLQRTAPERGHQRPPGVRLRRRRPTRLGRPVPLGRRGPRRAHEPARSTASTASPASSATAAAPATTCPPAARCTTPPAPTPTRSSRSPRSTAPPPRPGPAWRPSSTGTAG